MKNRIFMEMNHRHISLHNIGLSTRVVNALYRHEIRDLQTLAQIPTEELLQIYGIAMTAVEEIGKVFASSETLLLGDEVTEYEVSVRFSSLALQDKDKLTGKAVTFFQSEIRYDE